MTLKAFALLLFAVGMTCAGFDSKSAKRAFKKQLLTEHNLERNKAQSGMPNLVWSETLEGYAQEWTDKCVFDHRSKADLRSKQSGENLFAAWGYDLATIGTTAAKSWASEKADYDYGSNTCADGKTCGHYTAMVWADTQEVGCGFTKCEDGMQLVVCNYSPAGNSGGKPY